MKPHLLLLALLASTVTTSWAINGETSGAGVGVTASGGGMRVGVFRYRVGRWNYSEIYDGKNNERRDERRRSRRSWRELDEDAIGHAMAQEVSRELTNSGRFEVYDTRRLQREREYRDNTSTLSVGRNAALDTAITGRLQKIDTEVRCTASERKGKISYSWSAQVKVLTQHVATDVASGAIWREVELEKSLSRTFSDWPDESELEDIVLDAAKKTIKPFVRQLVPEVEGVVAGKENGRIVVNLGKRDGVGADVDFTFFRMIDVVGSNGKPILDPQTGEPLRRRVAIAAKPSPKHKNVMPCIGRASQIEDAFSLVQVGYNGSGGFFGPEYEWKQRDTFLDFLREGDIAVLTPRPLDSK
ncbi:MAG TPA: hypothetical protein VF719_00395 [Abditibacteriaceae bacterium]|jgi:hypothetical protein